MKTPTIVTRQECDAAHQRLLALSGSPATHRLPRVFRAWRARLARSRLYRLLSGRRPGRPFGAPERARHHAGVCLAAPQPAITKLKARTGWHMPWVTITDDFDNDFGVHEWHGQNAFICDGEQIFRTYFISGRGDETVGTVWSYLDMTALGRQELWEDSPEGYPQAAISGR